jgi:hypothetical protein
MYGLYGIYTVMRSIEVVSMRLGTSLQMCSAGSRFERVQAGQVTGALHFHMHDATHLDPWDYDGLETPEICLHAREGALVPRFPASEVSISHLTGTLSSVDAEVGGSNRHFFKAARRVLLLCEASLVVRPAACS